MRDEDTYILSRILMSDEPYESENLEKYALDKEIVEAFRQGFDRRYDQLRKEKLINIEKDFVARFL